MNGLYCMCAMFSSLSKEGLDVPCNEDISTSLHTSVKGAVMRISRNINTLSLAEQRAAILKTIVHPRMKIWLVLMSFQTLH